MNYNDQILENKAFNFSKQLVYNLALSVCIILIGVLLAVYGLGFKLFEVLSDSQAPHYVRGDLVIVKDKDSYEIGDILQFKQGNENVTHRLIATFEDNGETYYVCHGDNVQSANPKSGESIVPWEEDSKYVKNFINEYGPLTDHNAPSGTSVPINVQIVKESQVEGIVVNHIANLGSIIAFIKEHYLLVIALVSGIWCVSTVVQNEIDIKRSRRLI